MNPDKKILLIGRGFLGNYIFTEFQKSQYHVITTRIHESKNDIGLDVRNFQSVKSCLEKIKPFLIINCAGNNDIEYLEKNPKEAFNTNVHGVKLLADIAQKNGIRFLHISTDSVFDGKIGKYSENDLPNPLNVYAKSKVQAEDEIRKISGNYVIIRTNFYGHNSTGNYLFNQIIAMLKNKRDFTGFEDVIFSPLEVSNLSEMVEEIAMKDYCGILNLASNESLSKYQFALNIADIFNLDKNLVKIGFVDDVNFNAKRPKNTSLSNEKAKKILQTPILSVIEGLKRIKEQYYDHEH